jgi:hypothetical protein
MTRFMWSECLSVDGYDTGCAYLLLVTFQRDALLLDLLRRSNYSIDWSDSMFYSFVTLTPLGGGLVPVSPQARSLAILESVSGVLYVVVRITRLINGYSASLAARAPSSLRS